MSHTQDGSELLTGPGAGGLLRSAVGNSGGVLHSWQLDHVDHRPGRSTKALYRTQVSWPELDGPQAPAREELFGASAHIGEREKNLHVAEQTLVMTDGDINVRVWRYPHDPWLPMLPLVCYPDIVGRTLHDLGASISTDPSEPIAIDVVSYRPGRRAVLRASQGGRAVYLKVMQPHRSGEIVDRHHRLLAAGVPVPEVIAHHDGLVVLAELPGRPLARAVVDEGVDACRAEDLVALLDRLPASMYSLPLRPPWTDSVEFYAGIVSSSVPSLGPRLDALVRSIREGLGALESRMDVRAHDVVHGDFYEAQVFVENGKVVGLLDIDTVGPGRRADDLACLLAHLSVLADYGNVGRIDRATQERVEDAIRTWHGMFSERVDPTELALRSAGVVLSLATGPHRQQEAAWEAATEAIVRVAEVWITEARRAETHRLEVLAAKQAASAPAPQPATHPASQSASAHGSTGVRPVLPQGAAPSGQQVPTAQAPTAQAPSTRAPSAQVPPVRPSVAPQQGAAAPQQDRSTQGPSAQRQHSAPPHQSAPQQSAPQQSAPHQSAPQQSAPQRHFTPASQSAPQVDHLQQSPLQQQPGSQQPALQQSDPQQPSWQQPGPRTAPLQALPPQQAPPRRPANPQAPTHRAGPPPAGPPPTGPSAYSAPPENTAPIPLPGPEAALAQAARSQQPRPPTGSPEDDGDDTPTQERRIDTIFPR